jgi:hypothetical protein
MTDEEKILAMQSPSTRRLMELHKEGKRGNDADWPPGKWKAVENAATFEELTGARALNFQEVKVEEHLRYNRGAYLEEKFKDGEVTSLNLEKKEKAVEAFVTANNATIYSSIKAAFADLMRFTGLISKEKVKVEK